MNKTDLRKLLIWTLKANIIAWIIATVFFAVMLMLGFNLLTPINSAYFSKVLLLEAGIVFLIGGLAAFSSGIFPSKVKQSVTHKNEEWSIEKLNKSEKKANQYILLGFLLFMQSLIMGFLAL